MSEARHPPSPSSDTEKSCFRARFPAQTSYEILPDPVIDFKVVLLGDGAVGKTTFLKKHFTGDFSRIYMPTQGAEVIPLTFFTNYGPVRLNVWDTAGQEKMGGLREGYYLRADCAIIMFDVTSRMTYKNVPKWYKDMSRMCEDIPMCLIGNKTDLQQERKVHSRQVTYHKNKNMEYFDMSIKDNFQCDKPFLWILQQLLQDPKLKITEAPVSRPLRLKIIRKNKLETEQENNEDMQIREPLEDGNILITTYK